MILESGCEEEVEIRGCTIHAIELINQKVKGILTNVVENISENNDNDALVCNSVLLDHYFWNYRRQHRTEVENIPFHKTLSVYY